MDVREWLRGLGLGQYGQTFRDNKIDADVLADLTDGDLETLGIPLGDRKRLLKAIAASVALEPRPAHTRWVAGAPPSAQQIFAPPDAERRPITVMFCDLVGSTSLASRLDVEDFRDILNGYLNEAANAVTGLGGHVLRKLGDGLLALFGYPKAEENDAERAVRAALAIQRALAELNVRNSGTGVPELVARIGLESGPVIVDAAGEVFGEAPNVAARVQTAAEPGTVLVTATVQRQVAGLFIVEDKGAHELKGVPGPVTLYRIVRVSGGRRRRAPGFSPPLSAATRTLAFWPAAGNGPTRAKGSSCSSSASLASASPGWSKSFERGSAIGRTHGSNGVRRSSCRIHHCILS